MRTSRDNESRRVLVLDDEPDVADGLAEILQEDLEDIEVLVAYDPRKALAMLREAPVAVIVADYRLPGMTGLEFLAQAEEHSPRAARLLVTAYPDLQLAIRALNEQRVSFFLTKPVDPLLFVAEVAEVLADKRRQLEWSRRISAALGRYGRKRRAMAPRGHRAHKKR